MIESWMLADKELLKKEIGTVKTDFDLGISKRPEEYKNPKKIIEDAIRIAGLDITKRRRKDLLVRDLYSIIGQKISLNKLNE